jgi:hypothetical protein
MAGKKKDIAFDGGTSSIRNGKIGFPWATARSTSLRGVCLDLFRTLLLPSSVVAEVLVRSRDVGDEVLVCAAILDLLEP